MNESIISQPACTAVQIALIEVLASWNIRPQATVGHSSGEIAAAYGAGAFNLSTAMTIAYYRGTLAAIAARKTKGSMMAVGTGRAVMAPLLANITSGVVVVACENSENSVTVSGDIEAIAELQRIVEDKGIFNRILATPCAYHSPHMEIIADSYRHSLRNISPSKSSEIAFYSSLHGRRYRVHDLDADYWVENLIRPVRFLDALGQLVSLPEENGCDLIIELGPHPALQQPIKSIVDSFSKACSIDYLPSLLRRKNDQDNMLEVARSLLLRGCPVDIGSANNIETWAKKDQSPLNDLPPYSWTHEDRYWIETRYTRHSRFSDFARNDILGTIKFDSIDLEPTWRNTIAVDDLPWLTRISADELEYPMSGYLSMAIEAVFQLAVQAGLAFSDIKLKQVEVLEPLKLLPTKTFETQLTMRPLKARGISINGKPDVREWHRFEVFSWTNDQGWHRHCQGLATISGGSTMGDCRVNESERGYWSALRREIRAATTELSASDLYDWYEGKNNIKLSNCTKVLNELWVGDGIAHGRFIVPDAKLDTQYGYENPILLHPTILQTLFQTVAPAISNGNLDTIPQINYHGVANLNFSLLLARSSGTPLTIYSKTTTEKYQKSTTVSFIQQDPGAVLPGLRIDGLASTWRNAAADGIKAEPRTLCYKNVWKPHPRMIRSSYLQNQSIHIARKDSLEQDYIVLETYSQSSSPTQRELSESPKTPGLFSPTSVSSLLPRILLEDPYLAQAATAITTYMELLIHHSKSGFSIIGIGGLFAAITPRLLLALNDHEFSIVICGVSSNVFDAIATLSRNTASRCKLTYIDKADIIEKADLLVCSPYGDELGTNGIRATDIKDRLNDHGHYIKIDQKPCFSDFQGRDLACSLDNDAQQLVADSGRKHLTELSSDCSNEQWAVDIYGSSSSMAKNSLGVVIITDNDISINTQLPQTVDKVVSIQNLQLSDVVGKICLILDLNGRLLRRPDLNVYQKIQGFASHGHGIVWVVEGAFQDSKCPDGYLAAGFCRTLRCENPGLRCVLLDLEHRGGAIDFEALHSIEMVVDEVFASEKEAAATQDMEFMERAGNIHIPRVEVDTAINNYLYPSSPLGPVIDSPYGNTDTCLRLAPSALGFGKVPVLMEAQGHDSMVCAAQMVDLEVRASSVATTKSVDTPSLGDDPLGLVYTGIVVAIGHAVSDIHTGDRICAFTTQHFSTRMQVSALQILQIPDDMGFAEAASFYSTMGPVCFAMSMVGGLTSSATVLIHNAASRLGQAALALVKQTGCHALVTVQNEEGRQRIVDHFGIAVDHVFPNDEVYFGPAIRKLTDGRGVDLTIDTDASEKLADWDACLKSTGKVVHLSQGTRLAVMPRLLRNQQFILSDFQAALEDDPESALMPTKIKMLEIGNRRLMAPQPLRRLPLSKVDLALEMAQRSDIVGDVVVELQDMDIVKVSRLCCQQLFHEVSQKLTIPDSVPTQD